MTDDLTAFCEREYPRLVGALALYCGDAEVAEDLAQEALVRVIQKWERVRVMAAPGAWVHRVAINLAHSHFRRRAVGLRRERELSDRTGSGSDGADPADALALRQAVARLPHRERTAVVLHYYLGHSVAETAALLGAPDGTVKSLLSRARDRLQRRLQTV